MRITRWDHTLRESQLEIIRSAQRVPFCGRHRRAHFGHTHSIHTPYTIGTLYAVIIEAGEWFPQLNADEPRNGA